MSVNGWLSSIAYSSHCATEQPENVFLRYRRVLYYPADSSRGNKRHAKRLIIRGVIQCASCMRLTREFEVPLYRLLYSTNLQVLHINKTLIDFNKNVTETEIGCALEEAWRRKLIRPVVVEMYPMEGTSDNGIWVNWQLLTDFGSYIKVVIIPDEYVITLLGKSKSYYYPDCSTKCCK